MTETSQEGRKYGARVFKVSNDRLLIKQTVKSGKGQNNPYVIDGQKEKHGHAKGVMSLKMNVLYLEQLNGK